MGLLKSLSSFAVSAFGADKSCIMPSPEELFDTPLSDLADVFLTACSTEFNAKQKRLAEQWLTGCTRYDVDTERGLLQLSYESRPSVLFDATLVGSHNRSRGSWEWAWNNPNVAPSQALPKSTLAPVAEAHNLKYLLSGFVPVPMEEFPWYFCGIALKLTDALGVYQAVRGDVDFYLLLENPREGGGLRPN